MIEFIKGIPYFSSMQIHDTLRNHHAQAAATSRLILEGKEVD